MLHIDNDHQLRFVDGPSKRRPTTNPRLRTAAILKNQNSHISQQRFDRSSRNLASWRILGLWTVPAVKISIFSKFKMADDRHLEKKTKTAISPQRFDRLARHLARWCTLVLRTVLTVNISNYLKSQMAEVRYLKIKLKFLKRRFSAAIQAIRRTLTGWRVRPL